MLQDSTELSRFFRIMARSMKRCGRQEVTLGYVRLSGTLTHVIGLSDAAADLEKIAPCAKHCISWSLCCLVPFESQRCVRVITLGLVDRDGLPLQKAVLAVSNGGG